MQWLNLPLMKQRYRRLQSNQHLVNALNLVAELRYQGYRITPILTYVEMSSENEQRRNEGRVFAGYSGVSGKWL